MQMTPILSIIIATYNSDKTLKKTLKSLLNQTFTNFELIIIDGLSKDNTVEIIKNFEPAFKAMNIAYYWISESDSGIYDAWNKGLEKVTSNWVAFLGSDDTYYQNALHQYQLAITKNPTANYICSKVELINDRETVLKIIGNQYNAKQMRRYMNIAHVGSFHKMDLFHENGNFSRNYKIAGDYEFFIRNADAINGVFIDRITAKMLNEGVSNNLGKQAIKETLHIQLKYNSNFFLKPYLEYVLSLVKYNIKLLFNR